MADITKEQVIEWLSAQSVKDVVALVKELEELWGVSAAPVAVAGAAAAAAPIEEQTEFNVVLVEKGASGIAVIKAVREITGLGLKEAKELVESAPKAIKEGVSKDEAKTIADKLTAAGAKVEVK